MSSSSPDASNNSKSSKPNASQQSQLESQLQQQSTEEHLTQQLQRHSNKASKRPLEPTYETHLLLRSTTTRPPKLKRDNLYRKFGADLRSTVESYMQLYGPETVVGPSQGRGRGIGRYRKDVGLLDETKGECTQIGRYAFTLRECKPTSHEQKVLIKALLAANDTRRLPGFSMEESTRRKKMEAMALGLQQRGKEYKDRKLLNRARQKLLADEKASLEKERSALLFSSNSTSATTEDERKSKSASLEEKLRRTEEERSNVREDQLSRNQRQAAVQREKERLKARRLAERREQARLAKQKEEDERKRRRLETPEEALYHLYEPVFRDLWDMEFANLHNSNPFRIVIDSTNCAAMGCPDYVDVIKTPMNLTYIKEKVNEKKYETLQEFFEDLKLLIGNALKYNSDPENEYHKAAQMFKERVQMLGERVAREVQQQQQHG